MIDAFLLLAGYGLLALALWSMLTLTCGAVDERSLIQLLLAALCLAPLSHAWLLTQLLRLAPGQSDLLYVTLPFGVAGVIFLLPFRRFQLYFRTVRRPASVGLECVLLLIALLGVTAFLALRLPLYSNDPLEYATAARLIYRYRDASLYPFLDAARSGGFYGPWTHPAGFPVLLAWCHFISGTADYTPLLRLVPLYHAIMTVMVLWWLGGRWAGTIAGVLLLSTPLYFESVVNSYVDPVRVCAGVAAVLVVEQATRTKTLLSVVAVGFALGLAFFAHSIGIVMFPLLAIVYWIFSDLPWWQRFTYVLLFWMLAVLVVIPDLIANVRNFGKIVADAPAVWQIPQVQYEDHMRATRGLENAWQRIVFGLLQGLSKPSTFALAYWIFLGALFSFARSCIEAVKQSTAPWWYVIWEIIRRERWLAINLLMVSLYFAMSVLSVLVGIDHFIKNARYSLTVQPFVAFFSATLLMQAIRAWGAKRGADR